MKVKRIDFEGPVGVATARCEGRRIVITGTRGFPAGEEFRLEAGALDFPNQVARTLQRYLDGYRGTAGDVAEYQRVIEMLGT